VNFGAGRGAIAAVLAAAAIAGPSASTYNGSTAAAATALNIVGRHLQAGRLRQLNWSIMLNRPAVRGFFLRVIFTALVGMVIGAVHAEDIAKTPRSHSLANGARDGLQRGVELSENVPAGDSRKSSDRRHSKTVLAGPWHYGSMSPLVEIEPREGLLALFLGPNDGLELH